MKFPGSSRRNKPSSRFGCKGCGNHYSFVADEGEYIVDRDGDCYKVQCPNCKTVNWINASLMEAFTPSGADCHPESPHASTFKVKPFTKKEALAAKGKTTFK